jgi:hypothetical protein
MCVAAFFVVLVMWIPMFMFMFMSMSVVVFVMMFVVMIVVMLVVVFVVMIVVILMVFMVFGVIMVFVVMMNLMPPQHLLHNLLSPLISQHIRHKSKRNRRTINQHVNTITHQPQTIGINPVPHLHAHKRQIEAQKAENLARVGVGEDAG